MQSQHALTGLVPLLTRDLIQAIANRPDETDEQRLACAQTAMARIEALQPQDAAELMLAGQIVLFQNLILDAVNDAHRAETESGAYKNRQQAIALGRIQTSYLAELRRLRAEAASAESATPRSTPEEDPVPTPEPRVAESHEPKPPARPPETAPAAHLRPPATMDRTAVHSPVPHNQPFAQPAVARASPA